MLNKILKIVGIIAIVLVALSASYYFVSKANQNKQVKSKEPTREDQLRERFKLYSDMIGVGLCQEAYNEFITAGSQVRKGYQGFLYHCTYRKEKWKNFEIQNIVFSGDNRADIKMTYDLGRPDRNSREFRECADSDFSTYLSCLDSAPLAFEKTETIETWLFEENKWKRDY